MLEQLLNSSLIRTAYHIAKSDTQDIFLVGGALRDLYLTGSIPKDLDFLVTNNVKSLVHVFSHSYHGSFFCLDRKRECYRVFITHHDKYYTIDFSPILNGDIHSDLLSRDFSINSIALTLSDIFEKRELNFIDPTGGLNDFDKRQIRVSSSTSFSHDPVRILRAVRFARQFDFSLEAHTFNLIKESKRNMLMCSWERMRSEFFKILTLPHASQSLIELDRLGVLSLLIPEIERMKGVDQGTYHDYKLWEHSLKTVHYVETILHNITHYFPQHGKSLENYFRLQLESEIQRNNVLIFIALLHDIGKPLTKSEKNNQIHFYHHEREGRKINQEIAKRFKLGRKTSRIITTATQHHMRLLNLYHLEKITHRAKYRFFKDLEDAALDTLILTLADKMATRKPSPDSKNHITILTLVIDLINYFFQEYTKSIPKPLINGNEIMEILRLKPGKKIGELLALIANAEREGSISTKEDAVRLIRSSTYETTGKEFNHEEARKNKDKYL